MRKAKHCDPLAMKDLEASFGGVTLRARDELALQKCGGAGFLIDEGAMFIDGFLLERCLEWNM